jgi:hypothetical protein
MGITREMSKILSTSTAITTDEEISAYNYLSQGTASATYLNQTGYQPGMVLVTPTSAVNGTVGATGAVSFTSASAISLNGCFSSTYDNYRIIFAPNSFSLDNVDIGMRYRASNVDTSANYNGQRIFIYGTSVGADANHMGSDKIFVGTADKDYEDESASIIDCINPNKSNKTKTFANLIGWYATTFYLQLNGNVQQSNTQFDGFTIFPSGGTFTGTIRVYGYRN